MKERLVELIKQDNCMNPMTCSDKCPYVDLDDCHSARLADHLLANGVIVPPCKVGQTVYRIIEMSTGVMMNSTYTIKRFIRTVEVTKNNFFEDTLQEFDDNRIAYQKNQRNKSRMLSTEFPTTLYNYNYLYSTNKANLNKAQSNIVSLEKSIFSHYDIMREQVNQAKPHYL